MGYESGNKTYLGDSVYADFDGYHFVLTTEDGVTVSNTIYLDPDVYEALTLFQKKIIGEEDGKE